MKQRITPDQLQELTPSQQEKLREWWKPQRHDVPAIIQDGVFYEEDAIIDSDVEERFFFPDDCDFYLGVTKWHDKTNYLPLLNIGQCIELLFEQKTFREYPAKENEIMWTCGYDKGWLSVDWSNRNQGELIDALFEAVKSIL